MRSVTLSTLLFNKLRNYVWIFFLGTRKLKFEIEHPSIFRRHNSIRQIFTFSRLYQLWQSRLVREKTKLSRQNFIGK